MKFNTGCLLVGFLSMAISVVAQRPKADLASDSNVAPVAAVTGSGKTNYIPVWKNNTTLGDSNIYLNGTNVGIGTTQPGSQLEVEGHIDTDSSYRILGSTVLSLAGSASANNLSVGYKAFPGVRGADNTAVGANALGTGIGPAFDTAIGAFALYNDAGGVQNTATGSYALYANFSNDDGEATLNTADGNFALTANTTGSENTAVGTYALDKNTTGSNLTCIGYDCTTGADGLNNATAIGAHAVVSLSNALVLGGTGTYAVKVGIGTETPSNILTIAQGAGHPVSDGWETFSSRRWKTNIQPLHDALSKVEQLQGVSYDLKANGKHEVGVIAEEVGAIVPEVVSYEENGKDARSVDYSRLTALLIEATKEQQALIREQQQELKAQQAQIARLAGQVKTIQAAQKAGARTNSKVRTVKATQSGTMLQ